LAGGAVLDLQPAKDRVIARVADAQRAKVERLFMMQTPFPQGILGTEQPATRDFRIPRER
jgi:hypothetical protein